MIFTSISYLVFFATVLVVYWNLPRRGQNLFLLAASYFFYGFVHPWFCIVLAASTVVDYFVALAMDRHRRHRRVLLLVSLVFNLGLLGVFKYFNFFVENVQAVLAAAGWRVSLPVLQVVLPVGISFYTFQSLSYTIDVYRGLLRARTNLLDFALFVTLFPQLVAGPIERARNLLPQIERDRTIDFPRIESAVCLIVWGFFKKLVVADTLAISVDRLFTLPQLPGLMLFTAALGFSIQLFADFSAYTDIARGSARLMGFELMHNFKMPFAAPNPVEFWRRWHISLSSWIRDYVFVSLPDSRKSAWHLARNQMITFLIFGAWHGAQWNFIIWGAYYGFVTVIYALGIRPFTRKVRNPLWDRVLGLSGVAVCFLANMVGALLFRQRDFGTLVRYFTSNPFVHTPEQIVVGLGLLCFVLAFIMPMLVQILAVRWFPRSRLWRMALVWLCVAGIVFFGSEGAVEFVYFEF